MAKRICPFWVGYFLISPLRTLMQSPQKILSRYVTSGMKVLDTGCGMGFFSLPLARMVGSNGKVICVDVQEKMIKSLKKRAKKAGLTDRIETRISHQNSLGLNDLNEEIDFALAFAVIHEVLNTAQFFSEVYKALKPAGTLLIAEPKGHVSEKDFEITTTVAQHHGFKIINHPEIWRSRTILLQKSLDT
ncbi:MAG: methyltransferase type 11 [Thermodesulfovibrio sp. RBG_19FT_COMBO_42_12]|nr:MAG: methyltransferase type 11 [Thermodesulfovibrio sp. RBG_19FT_COMBO_42_12]